MSNGTGAASPVELACDYSFARPDPAAIAAAGYKAVIRYLSGGQDPGKDLSSSEAAALHDAGLGIGLVWETTAQQALTGANGGRADGAAMVAELERLGFPHGGLVLANIGDWAGLPDQVGTVHDYFYWMHQAALDYQFGGYGNAWIIEALVAQGAFAIWWQNAMTVNGISGSVVCQHASIYQRVKPTLTIEGVAAGQWDENVYGFATAPAWWMPAAAAPPAPVSPPPASAPVTLVSAELVAHYSDGSTRTFAA